MKMLNYTTEIDADKTIGEIQKLLVASGAKQILTEYDDNGIINALSFRLVRGNDFLSFRLPANIEGILTVLQNGNGIPKRLRTREQAARVGWRILKHWIAAQLALCQAECAEIEEVFFPYAQNQAGQTVYEKFKEEKFLQLTTTYKG